MPRLAERIVLLAERVTRLLRTGDDVSGWTIEGVQLEPYHYPLCEPFFQYAAGMLHSAAHVARECCHQHVPILGKEVDTVFVKHSLL